MRYVDVSTHIKDATLLHGLLDELIREIRLQHVVQVIMDNTANYVVVGRMLMVRYPALLWTPCVIHCLGLILEELGKIDWIKDTIDLARSITKFINNRVEVLSLMRRFTGDKEFVHPAITCFTIGFISLQSLMSSMRDLQVCSFHLSGVLYHLALD